MSPKLQQKNCNLVAAIFEFFGLGGGLKFESPSARSLEHVIVSVCKGRADELSTLMRTNAQGGKCLHSDTADKNERLKLKRSSRFR